MLRGHSRTLAQPSAPRLGAVCTGIGIVGVVGLIVLGGAALVARWQYFGPERRTSRVTFNSMAAGAALAVVALLTLWLGHC
jgi:uncharacterized membrane protein